MAKKIIKKSSKAKTSELDNLSFADGKINEDPDISKIKELEKALGIEKSNPFGTSNLEVFKETLSEMTNIDMQHMYISHFRKGLI